MYRHELFCQFGCSHSVRNATDVSDPRRTTWLTLGKSQLLRLPGGHSYASAGKCFYTPQQLEPQQPFVGPLYGTNNDLQREVGFDILRRWKGTSPLQFLQFELRDRYSLIGKAMDTQLKRKIAFAFSMGIVTTGVISFVIIAVNLGFSNGFALTWLRSWAIGYVVVIPAILLIGPWLQAQIDRLIR